MVASKLEVLLAVAASEYHQRGHIYFMPAGKEFVSTLRRMRSSGCIEPMNESYYRLTEKGWGYIRAHQIERFREMDAVIDKFVDGLK